MRLTHHYAQAHRAEKKSEKFFCRHSFIGFGVEVGASAAPPISPLAVGHSTIILNAPSEK